MTGRARPSVARAETIPLMTAGFGGLFLLAYFVETAVFSSLSPAVLLTEDWLVGFVTAAPFFSGLIAGGYWLHRSRLEPARHPRIATWCLGGAVAFFCLNLVTIMVWTPEDPWFAVGWLRNSLNVGAAGGLLVGIVEGRAIQHATEAERASVRAEYLEDSRDRLDYLNRVLRHEVLNNAQVIDGYTSILLAEDDLDQGARERLETIRRQTEDMTAVVADIRVLIEATQDEGRLGRVDLVSVVADECQDLRDSFDDVTVTTDLPERAVVRADDLLPRVFANLFENAVEHDTDPPCHLAVTAERRSDEVVVTVADDGPGVPPDRRDDLFERSTEVTEGDGIGLYLVQRLLDRYDGDVALRETGPDGSTFEVRLPLAEADDAADARSSAPAAATGW